MFSDLLGNGVVGSRGQHDLAAGGLLRAQIVDKRFPIWEVFRGNACMGRDSFLEAGAAPGEPKRKAQQIQRRLLHHLDQALHQGVCGRDRAVEVDNQRFTRDCGHGLFK
jgi:hypothetical protein